MQNILYVFLDTQVFELFRFNINNSHLKILKEYCNKGLLNLVIVDVTKKEIESRISKNCDQINQKINSYLNNVNKYLKSSDGSIIRDEISKFFEEEKIVTIINNKKDMLINQFNQFLTEIDCKIVPANIINVDNLYNLYFDILPPFENNNEKKHEFPDATMCLALQQYSIENDIPIHIITDDQGFKQFAKDKVNLIYHKQLSDFLDQLIDKPIKEKIHQYIEQNINDINNTVKNLCGHIGFEYYGDKYTDGYIQDYEIKEITQTNISILEYEAERAEIEIDFVIKILFDLDYVPHEAIRYDYEDKQTLYLDREKTELTRIINLKSLVKINYDIDTHEFCNLDIELLDQNIEIYDLN
ncbi:Uncharacterised protein [Legionella sainthelensi]|uniref:PIN domain-containing protein n=1 Tax=Legionella sainthelensi TaxID=28087 RepID=UPI000F6E0A44|nr:PIN domain-containing protein [Legionella sainthelensi]VEB36023.1 Uncharacterised protein [Legionella sainthelensi]